MAAIAKRINKLREVTDIAPSRPGSDDEDASPEATSAPAVLQGCEIVGGGERLLVTAFRPAQHAAPSPADTPEPPQRCTKGRDACAQGKRALWRFADVVTGIAFIVAVVFFFPGHQAFWRYIARCSTYTLHQSSSLIAGTRTYYCVPAGAPGRHAVVATAAPADALALYSFDPDRDLPPAPAPALRVYAGTAVLAEARPLVLLTQLHREGYTLAYRVEAANDTSTVLCARARFGDQCLPYLNAPTGARSSRTGSRTGSSNRDNSDETACTESVHYGTRINVTEPHAAGATAVALDVSAARPVEVRYHIEVTVDAFATPPADAQVRPWQHARGTCVALVMRRPARNTTDGSGNSSNLVGVADPRLDLASFHVLSTYSALYVATLALLGALVEAAFFFVVVVVAVRSLRLQFAPSPARDCRVRLSHEVANTLAGLLAADAAAHALKEKEEGSEGDEDDDDENKDKKTHGSSDMPSEKVPLLSAEAPA